MKTGNKSKDDILQELFQGRVVGGALSELANYSDLFQRMAEAVFLIDRNSLRVLECNAAALRLLRKNESEVLGVEIPELLQQKDYFSKKLKSAFEMTEISYQALDGAEVILETSATTLKILDYIEVVQFIARDVTVVRQAQRELQEMNAALTRLSTTDEMTGLRNYRYFKEVLASVHHECQNFQHEYGLIFIDVDHFKKFNDRNGHPAGDEVLRGVAKVLKETARAQDLPARYGGEEFVVLCRRSGVAETLRQAEIIRAKIEATDFPFGEYQPLGRVTVSIGVASYPESSRTAAETLEQADQALYFSKEAGRNHVTQYSELSHDQKVKKIAS